jgi:hypothetical protein
MRQLPAVNRRGQTTSEMVSRRRGRLLTCGLATGLALLAFAGSAQAASFAVNNTGDATDVTPGNGVCRTAVAGPAICTLRAAIVETEALAGADTITFSLPNPSTITLNTALPWIDDDLFVDGPGITMLTVRRNPAVATPAFRIFSTSGDDVDIDDMVITGGRDDGTAVDDDLFAGAGGGVANSGNLFLQDVRVTANSAVGATPTDDRFAIGGGIANTGFLAIDNTTVSNNTVSTTITASDALALSVGGGIGSIIGDIDVLDSTISGNTASANGGVDGTAVAGGGGIAAVFSVYDPNFVTNSTISGNTATASGGDALEVGGGLGVAGAGAFISGVTIAFNDAGTGANIGAIESYVSAYNTIVSNPLGGGENCADFGGEGDSIYSAGFNLASDDSCPFSNTGDQESVDPQLGPLQDNGSGEFTHLPAITSPAIDAGISDYNFGNSDQRGAARPVDLSDVANGPGDGADIGAVEVQAYEGEVLGDGPAGYWRHNEVTGTFLTDSSPNHNNGTYIGGVSLGVPGALVSEPGSTAATYDGIDDQGRVPDSATMDVGNSFTAEAWIKRSSTTKTHELMNKGGSGIHLVVQSAAAGNKVLLRRANVASIADSTVGVPADGAYHYVVATMNGLGSTAKIYIDGVDRTHIISPGQTILDTAFPMTFGSFGSAPATPAQYDELALYNAALSGAQVLAHYDASLNEH